ncbi:molecular chaperone DnaK (HSP70) [Rhizobium laguerreae]
MAQALGFDFGTTNTVLAMADGRGDALDGVHEHGGYG